MASGPITSWQIDGETMETVTDFISLGYKITADGVEKLIPEGGANRFKGPKLRECGKHGEQ